MSNRRKGIMMSRLFSRRRAAVGAAALGLLVGLGGCDSLLEVTNFEAIDERDLDDPLLVPEMVNAAVSEFQRDYSYLAWVGAIFTDEALNGHNFSQYRDLDLRIVEDDNTRLNAIYGIAQKARATGVEMAARIRKVVDNPSSSLPLATALTYAGYGHVILAEYFCYAPMNDQSPAIRSEAIMALGVEKFAEAIPIAQAAGGGAEAQRILNLARVGAARASLGQGKMADAISYASAVPADFVAWVRHANSPTYLRNHFFGATSGTNRTVGLDPAFLGLNDPRVRHDPSWVTGHNQSTQLYTPYRSASFAGWTKDGPDMVIDEVTDLRLASGLEARYIIAEAGGMSNEALRAFINERRAVGNQGEFAGADLMAELRDQRRRDFFMDGHRLGDLRRYLSQHGVDQFPSGPHPNDAQWGWGLYSTATCLVPHRNESVSNPHYVPLD
jgi:starch-binding outer membrane protein, SusD/RagB family